MNISRSAFVPEKLVSRDGFGGPVPRQPAHLHTQAEYGAYLREDSSRVPRAASYGVMIMIANPVKLENYFVSRDRFDRLVHSVSPPSLYPWAGSVAEISRENFETDKYMYVCMYVYTTSRQLLRFVC